jgi:polyhydroxybutyrate depolymerase
MDAAVPVAGFGQWWYIRAYYPYPLLEPATLKKLIHWFIRLPAAVLALGAGLAQVLAVAFVPSNRTNGSLVSAGRKRTYLLHVPKSYDPATPTPLVVSIHGHSEWPAHQMQMTRWNDLADRHGFIVVYPSGTRFPRRWLTHGTPGSKGDPAPDAAFISALIDKLENEYNLDPRRIYANGLSNGGGMTFVLSCRLSERLAAVGMVSGAYLLPWEECRPARPVPAIVFHGTVDPIVPYEGGPSNAFELPFPDIPAWVEALAGRNGCSAEPLELPARGAVRGVKFSGGASGAEVVFYTIAGGGHSWPGGGYMPKILVGHTTRDIDATQTMWEFFQEHPLEEIASVAKDAPSQ